MKSSIKNPAAVALGHMNAGKPRHYSAGELKRRRDLGSTLTARRIAKRSAQKNLYGGHVPSAENLNK